MANINLLPWREWERERKKKEFVIQIVAVLAVLALGLLVRLRLGGQPGPRDHG